ncbi:hypothetical protein CHM34_13075 [Paludifilum halophilum]|uniref:Uncharacterized protein n=1 Tax=Paludifilum halophilum TaxID=1642702 RepID=A0A235B3Q8_9BACL|nr:hypothetical protein CHM34_13075 [Paludifilum halophilum]
MRFHDDHSLVVIHHQPMDMKGKWFLFLDRSFRPLFVPEILRMKNINGLSGEEGLMSGASLYTGHMMALK